MISPRVRRPSASCRNLAPYSLSSNGGEAVPLLERLVEEDVGPGDGEEVEACERRVIGDERDDADPGHVAEDPAFIRREGLVGGDGVDASDQVEEPRREGVAPGFVRHGVLDGDVRRRSRVPELAQLYDVHVSPCLLRDP